MLTATYSLVAIAAEQDAAHRLLRRLRQYVQNIWHGIQKIDFNFLDTAFGKLGEFDDYLHRRKLEVYVIPALRKATREADTLLAELDALSATGMRVLRSAREQLSTALDAGGASLHEVRVAMQMYCDRLFARLTKEEEELFPLLRRVLSVEEWFAIAAQLLSDAAGMNGRTRHSRTPLRTSPSNPAPNLSTN